MATTSLSARPAALAAARVSRASLSIGALGIATAVFTLERVLESWRVSPRAAPGHTITLLGHKLSYPAANVGAIAVLALALLGLIVTLTAIRAAVAELIRSHRLGRALRRRARPRPDGTFVLEERTPDAFSAGLLRPRVYITTGALALLDDAAATAVLIHERHHAARRDPLRLAAGRVLARALFFVPALRALTEHQQTLAELGADEQAADAGRAALARALLAMGPTGGIDAGRVDHLTSPQRWRFPFAICLTASAILVLLAATAALAAQVARGSTTLAPPLLSGRPCIVMFAAVPAAAVLLAVRRLRRRRARR